jgi:hypothetical protein
VSLSTSDDTDCGPGYSAGKCQIPIFKFSMFDEILKSRHFGGNRSPDKLEPIAITGFRPSPE